jgi:hypothetical protein
MSQFVSSKGMKSSKHTSIGILTFRPLHTEQPRNVLPEMEFGVEIPGDGGSSEESSGGGSYTWSLFGARYH